MKVVTTTRVRDHRGRVVTDHAKQERILDDVGDTIARHHKCRVCEGRNPDCIWCVAGVPKVGCADCVEPLPMCACLRRYFGRSA